MVDKQGQASACHMGVQCSAAGACLLLLATSIHCCAAPHPCTHPPTLAPGCSCVEAVRDLEVVTALLKSAAADGEKVLVVQF